MKYLITIICISLLAFSCKKEEVVVEPEYDQIRFEIWYDTLMDFRVAWPRPYNGVPAQISKWDTIYATDSTTIRYENEPGGNSPISVDILDEADRFKSTLYIYKYLNDSLIDSLISVQGTGAF